MTVAQLTASVLSSVEATGASKPRVVLYTPNARANPFQQLLYSASWRRGIAAVPCQDFRDLRAAHSAVASGGLAAIHLHWTSNITAGCTTVDEYRLRCQEFLGVVSELRSIGVRLIWTIHNAIEHASAFPTAEIEFRTALAEAADVVHIMSEHAIDELAPFYPIDVRKTVVIPHPSYIGVYPDFVASADCRSRFGLTSSELVVGVLGGVRRYKRIDAVQRACTEARGMDHRVRLLVAGNISHPSETADVVGSLRRDPWTVLQFGRLSDRELSEAALACDVIACAYDSPLTSGVSLLAMSLRRAVILPDRPISREVAGEAGIYVEPGDHESLVSCIADLDRRDLAKRGVVARRRAEDVRYDIVAERFADILDELV